MAKTVTSPAGSSERRSGYTLIELMVVLLIIGAALSLALPRLDSFLPQLRLKRGSSGTKPAPGPSSRR
ncbi:MAG: Tfp pilus assembly protein FimT/FimU [Dongiales bacterium]